MSQIKKWTDYIAEGVDEETINIVYKSLKSMAEKAGSVDFKKCEVVTLGGSTLGR